MKVAALITAILQTLSLKTPHEETCEHFAKASEIAPLILDAIEAEYALQIENRKSNKHRPVPSRVPAKLVVAVMRVESTFRMTARGKAGEYGLMQVKPDGLALKVCPDLLDRLEEPHANVECGVRIMGYLRRWCGGDPENFLTPYNGGSCGPSKYAEKVLGFARMAGWPPPGVLVGAMP